jgi:hypothetical protein
MPFDGKPKTVSRFPASVSYMRFDWGDLEPKRATYRWEIIDSLIAAYKAKGITFAFRVMATDPQARSKAASPQWLFDLGCRSFEYASGGSGTFQGGDSIKRIEPDYADPIFLSEHETFISELGKRYNGDPNIEFVDIGSYGIWGEWHTSHPADMKTRKRIVDMYINAFKKTRLVMMGADPEALAYAVSRGTGIRRDGVGSLWDIKAWSDTNKYPRSLVDEVWKKAPVVFEWYGYYSYLSHCDHCSFDAGFQFLLDNHVTYINDNIGHVPDSIFSRLRVLGEKSGYRFLLNEISNDDDIRLGDKLSVRMSWSNVGVAPLYQEHYLSLSLIDVNGKIVLSQQLRHSIKQWLPGNYRIDERLLIPATLPPGKYAIGVAMVNAKTHQADIRFPLNALEKNGIYSVSSVTIR